jgi:adenylylsulfate kinase-like enzyme
MTGIDDPYEPPDAPDLVFDQGTAASAAAARIDDWLRGRLERTA